MAKQNKRNIRLEIKEISAEGYFEGLLSPYGNVDGGGDVVEPGSYTKTLQEHGNKVPLLWQHKSDMPIGDLSLEDRADGLWCKGQLLMALPEAQKAYLLIKSGVVKGLSIGFQSIKDAIVDGIRRIKEIRLFEGSIVTFPMNESALIVAVKGDSEVKGDFNEELTEIQLRAACSQMMWALGHALSSVTYSDLSNEEKVSTSETVIQQFADAYMAFLPNYLDMMTADVAPMYGGGMEMYSLQRLVEVKAGRKISAATMAMMKSASDHIKGGHDILLALLEAEAAEESDTSKSTAATEQQGTEPEQDHSSLISKLETLKGAFKWNN